VLSDVSRFVVQILDVGTTRKAETDDDDKARPRTKRTRHGAAATLNLHVSTLLHQTFIARSFYFVMEDAIEMEDASEEHEFPVARGGEQDSTSQATDTYRESGDHKDPEQLEQQEFLRRLPRGALLALEDRDDDDDGPDLLDGDETASVLSKCDLERVRLRIQELGDELLEADHENLFRLFYNDYSSEGYRPKGGDYNNLKRFVSELYGCVSDRYYYLHYNFPAMAIWLPNNDGICNFGWTDDYCIGDEGFCNDRLYTAGLRVRPSKLSDVLQICIYLSQEREHNANSDCVLDSITSLTPPAFKQLVLEGKTQHSMPVSCVDDYFTVAAWRRCLNTMAQNDVGLRLESVSLSQEQWDVLQSVPLPELYVDVPVPYSFWRETKISEITHRARNGITTADAINILSALGERTMPIGKIRLDWIWPPQQRSVAYENAFLAALDKVERFGVCHFRASLDAWMRIWRSRDLQMNATLLELSFMFDLDIRYTHRWALEVHHLEVIRECLQVNWVLQEIKIPHGDLLDDALEYFRANIKPLLDLNRSHVPRLEPGEDRLSVVHDAIIRVRRHPEKVFKLLLKHPQVLPHTIAQEGLIGLESFTSEHLEANALACTHALLNEPKMEGQGPPTCSGNKRARGDDSGLLEQL
jgi:hypothetical protein